MTECDPCERSVDLTELLMVAGSYTASQPHGGLVRRLLGFARDRGRSVRAPVHLLGFDPGSGRVRLLADLNGLRNVSWLAAHPTSDTVYGVSERSAGAVAAIEVSRGAAGARVLNSARSGGSLPCYVTVDGGGRHLYVANYGSGTVSLHHIEQGAQVGAPAQVIQHRGAGPDRVRQKSAHPHAVVLSPDGRFALVADLGMDRLFVYRVDPDTGRLVDHWQSALSPGAGPRHPAFHATRPLVYVVNEMGCTVASFAWDAESGTLEPRSVVSTLPVSWQGKATAADIRVHPAGRFVYVSNRGPDSIAVIATTPDGGLDFVTSIRSGGSTPRSFTLDPAGRHLLAAHQDSPLLTTFTIDDASGTLTEIARSAVPEIVCLEFLRTGS